MSPLQSGILLIDKPEGFTSHDVVAKARKILKTKAIGHCGTLDPMATGLLILLVGDATKLSDHLLTQEKSYETTVQLGLETDTLDITGEVTREKDIEEVLSVLSEEKVSHVVAEMTGEIELEIPLYSAKKVNGKKLYELARENKPVDLPKKKMVFSKVEFKGLNEAKATVALSCEKGGFIRAWGKELGARLRVGGALSQLRRVSSFPWHVDNAIELSSLEEQVVQGKSLVELSPSFVPMKNALPHMKELIVDAQERKLLSHGQIAHSLSSRLIPERKKAVRDKEIIGIKVMDKERSQLLALLQATPDRGLKIKKVFIRSS